MSTSPTKRLSRSPLRFATTARDERREAAVEALAQPREQAQRDVVRGEPLAVAQHRAGEPERAHGDDRHHQRQDRRALRGARDQIAGGRRAARSPRAPHRRRARPTPRGGEARPARAERRSAAPSCARGSCRHEARLGSRVRRGSSTWPPSDDLCMVGERREKRVVDDQQRRAPALASRRIVSPIVCALSSSRCAVGSSSTSSGRSRGTRARARSAGPARPRVVCAPSPTSRLEVPWQAVHELRGARSRPRPGSISARWRPAGTARCSPRSCR